MKPIEKKFREVYKKHKRYMTLKLSLGLEDGEVWEYYQSSTGHRTFKSEKEAIDYMGSLLTTNPKDILRRKIQDIESDLIYKQEEMDETQSSLTFLKDELKYFDEWNKSA